MQREAGKQENDDGDEIGGKMVFHMFGNGFSIILHPSHHRAFEQTDINSNTSPHTMLTKAENWRKTSRKNLVVL